MEKATSRKEKGRGSEEREREREMDNGGKRPKGYWSRVQQRLGQLKKGMLNN